ncbi:MAG: hypothetical protein Q8N51_16330 [Gammaproteobacteria bacterium]|nr:hypothetical protein [Gammaproteobacteria bacterium]
MVSKCVVSVRVKWVGGNDNAAFGGQVFGQVRGGLDWLFLALQKAGALEAWSLTPDLCSDDEGGTVSVAYDVKTFEYPEMEVRR